MKLSDLEENLGLVNDPAFITATCLTGLRLQMRLTQAEFARKVGVNQSAIARAESCEHSVSVSFLSRIAKKVNKKLVIDFED